MANQQTPNNRPQQGQSGNQAGQRQAGSPDQEFERNKQAKGAPSSERNERSER